MRVPPLCANTFDHLEQPVFLIETVFDCHILISSRCFPLPGRPRLPS
jgi:hypothetical protein